MLVRSKLKDMWKRASFRKEPNMNLYILQDPDNGNFLTARYKWSPHMYKARLFTAVSNANRARADLRKKMPEKKYIVKEYELLHRKDR